MKDATGTLIARVCGGLGNQLFIYASAKGIARAVSRELWLDSISGFERDSYGRVYMLDKFCLRVPLLPRHNSYTGAVGRIRYRLTRKLSAIVRLRIGRYISERGRFFDPELLKIPIAKKKVYLDGYLQSPRYFENIRKELLQELTPVVNLNDNDERLADRLTCRKSICLHFRSYKELRDGGHKWRVVEAYYQKAIAYFESKQPNSTFYVFSDDAKMARKIFGYKKAFHYVESDCPSSNNRALLEMQLMRKCANFVIGNSTFAWWAAWLSTSKDKEVLAPNSPGLLPNRDFFPKEWTLL